MTNGITPEPEPEPAREPQPVVTTQPMKSTLERIDPEPIPATENTPDEQAEAPDASVSTPICKDPRFEMYFDMVKKVSSKRRARIAAEFFDRFGSRNSPCMFKST